MAAGGDSGPAGLGNRLQALGRAGDGIGQRVDTAGGVSIGQGDDVAAGGGNESGVFIQCIGQIRHKSAQRTAAGPDCHTHGTDSHGVAHTGDHTEGGQVESAIGWCLRRGGSGSHSPPGLEGHTDRVTRKGRRIGGVGVYRCL